ncbi:hypothetical protein [Pararhodobacter zhoushanensis]|uniref:hypothetical protein n=1 Tax=Pararhodobacter zhoushanensis TaxID=2479545 RepID=UPI000F8D7F66|nr:hypothetical protein [Pararhodobacter zhoushanensis]
MIDIGNSFALLALLGWPVVGVLMFRIMPPERALIWSILAAYMFLPQLSSINLPVVPPMNKESIPNLTAFLCCLGLWGRMPHLLPEGWPGRILLGMFIVSPAFSVVTNLDAVQFGVDTFGTMRLVDPNALALWGLPGLRIYDSASALVQQMFLMLPFFLARELLRTEEAIREILLALVIAGLIYALPMLYEVRFSPQLHIRLYGFFQHDFSQAVRNGGFRPFVFMPHGLWVAFFAFMVALAASARAREATRLVAGRRMVMVVFGVGLVVICKSMGALMFTLIFLPIVLLLRPRAHLAIAAIIVTLVIAYPLLRGSGLVPAQAIVDRVAAISEERAESLNYRFTNEDRIIEHVADKPLFGWGGWGRFMVYDPATGESLTIVDGMWIITIGQYGWLGYIAMFGLLALPVLSLWWEGRKPEAPPIPFAASALALMLAVNLIDLLPNATLIPFTWLIAGSLLGYAEALRTTNRATRTARMRNAHAGLVLGTTVAPDRAPDKPRTLM